jgi:hypothetical protein
MQDASDACPLVAACKTLIAAMVRNADKSQGSAAPLASVKQLRAIRIEQEEREKQKSKAKEDVKPTISVVQPPPSNITTHTEDGLASKPDDQTPIIDPSMRTDSWGGGLSIPPQLSPLQIPPLGHSASLQQMQRPFPRVSGLCWSPKGALFHFHSLLGVQELHAQK